MSLLKVLNVTPACFNARFLETSRVGGMDQNPWYIYFMDHRGGFDEAIKTARAVNPVDLKMNFPLYEFYSFDGRCGDGSMRFKVKDICKATAIGMPFWIVFATLPKEKWGRV